MPTARDHPPEEAAEDTSFARGLRLLLVIADRGAIRADDLAMLLDMPLSTAYRYLRTLTEFGFVDRHEGRYRLGPKLVIGSGSHVTSDLLIRLSEPVLRMLVESQGETAVVMRRVGLSAMCLHQHESRHGIRVALACRRPQGPRVALERKVVLHVRHRHPRPHRVDRHAVGVRGDQARRHHGPDHP